jgi:integrase/recombinase XerD
MLEYYYVKPSTIDRVRSSWLAPQIESYLEWLQAHSYSRLVVYRRLPLFLTLPSSHRRTVAETLLLARLT